MKLQRYFWVLMLMLSTGFSHAVCQEYHIELGEGFTFYKIDSTGDICYKPGFADTVVHYFAPDPADTSGTSTRKPIPRVNWKVISNVRAVGYNKKYVLVSSFSGNKYSYWFIDKTVEEVKESSDPENENIFLSNIHKINQSKFKRLQRKWQIMVEGV